MKNKNLRSLQGRKKIQYIWDYYKLPLAALCILLYISGYILYAHITHKDAVLYTAMVNVTAGDTLTGQLSTNFVDSMEIDDSRQEVVLYTGLYLTDNELNAYHEYTYASRMKILAAIEGRLMDVVLMDREAFEAFSQNGYLYDLDELLSQQAPALHQRLQENLISGMVILEDNSNERVFDDTIPYNAVIEEKLLGLDLSQSAFIQQAGFEDTVYLGIIANSPRMDMALCYLEYLFLE